MVLFVMFPLTRCFICGVYPDAPLGLPFCRHFTDLFCTLPELRSQRAVQRLELHESSIRNTVIFYFPHFSICEFRDSFKQTRVSGKLQTDLLAIFLFFVMP
jgi:hypothetical protein